VKVWRRLWYSLF